MHSQLRCHLPARRHCRTWCGHPTVQPSHHYHRHRHRQGRSMGTRRRGKKKGPPGPGAGTPPRPCGQQNWPTPALMAHRKKAAMPRGQLAAPAVGGARQRRAGWSTVDDAGKRAGRRGRASPCRLTASPCRRLDHLQPAARPMPAVRRPCHSVQSPEVMMSGPWVGVAVAVVASRCAPPVEAPATASYRCGALDGRAQGGQ